MGVGAGLYMYDVVVKKFTFAISSPDEFLLEHSGHKTLTTSTPLLGRNRITSTTRHRGSTSTR